MKKRTSLGLVALFTSLTLLITMNLQFEHLKVPPRRPPFPFSIPSHCFPLLCSFLPCWCRWWSFPIVPQIDVQHHEPFVSTEVGTYIGAFCCVCLCGYWHQYVMFWCGCGLQRPWGGALQGLPRGIVESTSDLKLKPLWMSSSFESKVIY